MKYFRLRGRVKMQRRDGDAHPGRGRRCTHDIASTDCQKLSSAPPYCFGSERSKLKESAPTLSLAMTLQPQSAASATTRPCGSGHRGTNTKLRDRFIHRGISS